LQVSQKIVPLISKYWSTIGRLQAAQVTVEGAACSNSAWSNWSPSGSGEAASEPVDIAHPSPGPFALVIWELFS
jgi:hypothetical protein